MKETRQCSATKGSNILVAPANYDCVTATGNQDTRGEMKIEKVKTANSGGLVFQLRW